MIIAKAPFDLIVSEEVSSETYYKRHYTHPEWPGGGSGITVAIGYDLGMASPAKIRSDWSSRVSPAMLSVMASCSGVTGHAAKQLLPHVKNQIVIPWDAALAVFANIDIPQWTARCAAILPGFDKLNGTCAGVLVSIAYNRGAGGFTSSSDRNKEMRAIFLCMRSGRYDGIPEQIESMKRLWPAAVGLRNRRQHEADMFRAGLAMTAPEEPAPAIRVNANQITPDTQTLDMSREDKPARTPAPVTSPKQVAVTTTLAASGGTVIKNGVEAGWSPLQIVVAIVVTIAVAGGVFYVWHRWRNPK